MKVKANSTEPIEDVALEEVELHGAETWRMTKNNTKKCRHS